MKLKELKFILKLIAKPNYQGKISAFKLTDRTNVLETEQICRDLGNRLLVAYNEEIEKIKLTAAGIDFLGLPPAELTITADELKILQVCQKGSISSLSRIKLKAAQKAKAANNLIQRRLIEVVANKITEAWITDKGKEFLATEYSPTGCGKMIVSQKMFADYLRFLRQYLASSQSSAK